MSSDRRQEAGAIGEQHAARHLQRRGFGLVARNHRTRHGEIDLIAFDGRTLVFCEVKTRRSRGAAPLESIDARKRARIRRLARAWLAETPDRPRARELRFDAIAVTLDADGALAALEHVEGAF